MTRHLLCMRSLLLVLELAVFGLGCTTNPHLSLGHHEAEPIDPMSADPPFMPPPFDAAMPMAGQGGDGDGDGDMHMDPFDGSMTFPPFPEAGMPAPSICTATSISLALECEVDSPQPPFGGSQPTQTMEAASVLHLEPSQRGDIALDGDLAFNAWNADFSARIVGFLDCDQRVMHADIVDGTFVPTPQTGMPPGMFFGQLDGQLDPFTDELSGMWWHGPSTQGGPRCLGTWTATP